ncbi:MAG: hypothetical protein JRI92_04400 [Deltaproteobacteria bacterium]|nr:hypothetical protein [Deltaproteobacteria bacterium]
MNHLTIQRDTLHASRDTLKLTQLTKIGQFEDKNMQNEPNFKNAQIDVRSFTAINYANLHPFDRPKNEPIYKKRTQFLSASLSIVALEKMEASGEGGLPANYRGTHY